MSVIRRKVLIYNWGTCKYKKLPMLGVNLAEYMAQFAGLVQVTANQNYDIVFFPSLVALPLAAKIYETQNMRGFCILGLADFLPKADMSSCTGRIKLDTGIELGAKCVLIGSKSQRRYLYTRDSYINTAYNMLDDARVSNLPTVLGFTVDIQNTNVEAEFKTQCIDVLALRDNPENMVFVLEFSDNQMWSSSQVQNICQVCRNCLNQYVNEPYSEYARIAVSIPAGYRMDEIVNYLSMPDVDGWYVDTYCSKMSYVINCMEEMNRVC